MTSRSRTTSTAQSLTRLLAAWLALALLAQALAIGATAVMGRAHRHAAQQSEAGFTWVWRHGVNDVAPAAQRADAHATAHTEGLPHHHAADATVLPAGPDAGAEATVVAALLAVPVLQSLHTFVLADLDHVWTALPPWAATAHTVIPPRRPPRA